MNKSKSNNQSTRSSRQEKSKSRTFSSHSAEITVVDERRVCCEEARNLVITVGDGQR